MQPTRWTEVLGSGMRRFRALQNRHADWATTVCEPSMPFYQSSTDDRPPRIQGCDLCSERRAKGWERGGRGKRKRGGGEDPLGNSGESWSICLAGDTPHRSATARRRQPIVPNNTDSADQYSTIAICKQGITHMPLIRKLAVEGYAKITSLLIIARKRSRRRGVSAARLRSAARSPRLAISNALRCEASRLHRARARLLGRPRRMV